MTIDRRNPHGPFDESLIEKFLDGRKVVSADLLTSGKINTNFKLALSDGLTCVLRLYSQGNADREDYVMSLVNQLVPVPRQLAKGEGWAVFSFLEGVLLTDVPQHTGAAAEALAKISSIGFDSRGWINADGSISPFPFESDDDSGGFISEIMEHDAVLEWIGRSSAEAISEIMDSKSATLAEINAERHLVHGDFNPTNILISDGEVSGVLDWEFAHSGSSYMDIGNLLRYADAEYHDDIRAGLESGGMSLPDDWQERAALIDVGSYLESLTSNRADGFKRECVARIEDFIRRFGG